LKSKWRYSTQCSNEGFFREFFHTSTSSLCHQASRNWHNDNMNVLEYFERRLDDHVHVGVLSYNVKNKMQAKAFLIYLVFYLMTRWEVHFYIDPVWSGTMLLKVDSPAPLNDQQVLEDQDLSMWYKKCKISTVFGKK